MRSNPTFLIKGKTFGSAFPTVKSATILVDESYPFGSRSIREQWVIPESQLADFIDCHRPECDGGVSIGDLLHEMVSRQKTDRKVTKQCEGNNGKCKSPLSIRVQLVFR